MAELIREGSKYRTVVKQARDDVRGDADVVIGDENSSRFEPHVRVKRWGEEAHFAFGLTAPRSITPTDDGKKVTWIDGNQKFEFYPLAADRASSLGGFEYSILLGEKPASNKFVFRVDMQGLEAHYQTPLTAEAKGPPFYSTRPPKIEGSLAFYRPGPQMYSRPGDASKYQAGKAFHMFRPEAIDFNGARIWGDLDYDEIAGTLTLAFDATWLSRAAYPVLIDPEVGYSTLGSSNDNTNGFLIGNKFTAPEAGDANPGTAFIGGWSTAGDDDHMFGAYTGDDSTPDAEDLLATAGPITMTQSTEGAAQFESAAITWTGITATGYWLSVNGENGSRTLWDTGAGFYYRERAHSDDMPDPWGSSSLSGTSRKISMYVDYTASAAGANPKGPLGHPLWGPSAGPVGG